MDVIAGAMTNSLTNSLTHCVLSNLLSYSYLAVASVHYKIIKLVVGLAWWMYQNV